MSVPTGLIGVVHLPALPGDPDHPSPYVAGPGYSAAVDFALEDARAFAQAGVSNLIVENFGSAPFAKGTQADPMPAYQAAALARCCNEIRKEWPGLLGVNCLRNDAQAALGIAAACELQFVRINVHSGAFVTDQGIIEGDAAHSLRTRQALGLSDSVSILADVLVKHASPLAPVNARDAAADLAKRGKADAILVSGVATGAPVSAEFIAEVRAGVGDAYPLLIGSGLAIDNAPQLSALVEGAIIGSSVKRNGELAQAVDAQRARALASNCAFRSN